MPRLRNMKPGLSDLIIEHLKEELPKALHKTLDDGSHECTVLQRDKPILKIVVCKDRIDISSQTCSLSDSFTIGDTYIVTGKWADQQRIEAANPCMFGMFDYYLAMTGCLVTMGWLPHPANFMASNPK